MNDSDKLDDLLQKLFDAALTDEERFELETIIKNSPDERQRYLEYCQIHAVLSENNGALAATQVPSKSGKPSRSKLFLWLAAAAAVIVAGLFPLLQKKNSDNPKNQVYRGTSLAVLTNSSGAVFAYGGKEGSPLKDGDEMFAGIYKLDQGVIRIEYPHQGSVIIEAPCEFELITDMNIFCSQGKISASVPIQARNFTVSTAQASIVDLGTEFSVNATADQNVEVHVFEGKVNVVLYYESNEEAFVVEEGKAVKILKDQSGPVLTGIDLKHDLFIRQMTEPKSNYAEIVFSHNPVAYYPMDIPSDGKTVRDWSQYKNNGLLADVQDEVNLWSAGKIGTALKLSGSNRKAYCYVTDYPKTQNNKLTVAGWVNASSRPKWATIMKNWANDKIGQFHFGLYSDGRLDVEISDRNGAKVHVTDSELFPTNKWVHAAFVHDGSTVKVFRNGVIVATGEVNGINFPADIKKMSIGTKLDDTETFPAPGTPGHWDGRLDELAVFNKALTDKEILQLYQSAK